MVKISFHGVIPTRATKYSAGYDLRSPGDILIPAGATVGVDTGTYVSMPWDLCALVCSRSGLALRGLAVANAPGIIVTTATLSRCYCITVHKVTGSLRQETE